MAGNPRYYRHSGAVGVVGPLLMSVAGLVAALVLGTVYGLADWYSPLIYVNFLLTCCLGGGVGIAVGWAAKVTRVRNIVVTSAISVIFSAVALYVSWVIWIAAATEFDMWVFEPAKLWAVVEVVNAKGAWSMKDLTPTGWMLWSIWGVEAAVVVGMAVYGPKLVLGTTPFCERCDRWIENPVTHGPLQAILLPGPLVEELEQGNLASLKKLPKVQPGVEQFSEVELAACPTCDEMRLISVRNVVIGVDKHGKLTRTAQNIALNLLLNQNMHTELTRHFEALPAAHVSSPFDELDDAPGAPPNIKL